MENNKKYWFFGSKLNTALLFILIILMIIALRWMYQDKEKYLPNNRVPAETLQFGEDQSTIEYNNNLNSVKDTYTYINHGFSIELPEGFIPKESLPDKGSIMIFLPEADITYLFDVSTWDSKAQRLKGYTYSNDKKIGDITFKVYEYKGQNDAHSVYLFEQGDLAYILSDEHIAQTFKFVGWPQVEGNKEDLVSFSIKPGQEVSGIVKATGVLSGGYFFEGNLPVSILDENKKLTSYGPGHGQAITDSWTAGPVSFNIDFDFTKIPKGKYYIKLTQDDPSGGESGIPVSSILIPITVK